MFSAAKIGRYSVSGTYLFKNLQTSVFCCIFAQSSVKPKRDESKRYL